MSDEQEKGIPLTRQLSDLLQGFTVKHELSFDEIISLMFMVTGAMAAIKIETEPGSDSIMLRIPQKDGLLEVKATLIDSKGETIN